MKTVHIPQGIKESCFFFSKSRTIKIREAIAIKLNTKSGLGFLVA
jgi:hypothetical protein